MPDSALDSLLTVLNPHQHEAVSLPADVHALVLAGAGSGKTRVLTTRMAYLLMTGSAHPGSLLAVTFTNKAAQEMRTRLVQWLPTMAVNLNTLWMGTFHGLCHRMLRRHTKAAGLPDGFQILDAQDQLSAIKRVLKAQGIEEAQQPAKELLYFIMRHKEQGTRASHVQTQHSKERGLVELYALYEAQCEREGVVDFAELLLRSYELLQDQADIRAYYQARFSHILIDEFQDTNALQYRWLKLLANHPVSGAKFFAVGDDDQSIYAFRGAEVANMQAFVDEFHVQHIIKLERNYRSTGHILNAANTLIAHNQSRLGKNLYTEGDEGNPLCAMAHSTDWNEAYWLAQTVRELHSEGVAYREMAVLYRSNAQSRSIESALLNAGVAYRVYGGLRYFERAEVKHALAYLRLLANPHDDTSFLRVVNFPTRGIGAKTLSDLQNLATNSSCSLYQAAQNTTTQAHAKLAPFLALIAELQQATQGVTLSKTVECVIHQSGLRAHYESDKSANAQDRLENLDELVSAAAQFDQQHAWLQAESEEAMSTLDAFLSYTALEAGDTQADTVQDAVQLMSVHAAKGLEFEVVFITGLEDGLFPHANALFAQGGLEEERRLMYVAITRAKRQLFLSLAASRLLNGKHQDKIPSRFLKELPANGVQWLGGRAPSPLHGLAPSPFQGEGWDGGRNGGKSSLTGSPASTPTLPSPWKGEETPTPRNATWHLGQAVFHAAFGEGKILRLTGQGAEQTARIHFKRHGVKEVSLSMGKVVAA